MQEQEPLIAVEMEDARPLKPTSSENLMERSRTLFLCLRKKITWRLLLITLIIVAITVVLILSAILDSPIVSVEAWFLSYVQNDLDPTAASAVLFAVSTIFVLLGLPLTPLNLASGFILGALMGSAVSVCGLSVGAIVAFILGRTALKKWAEEKARGHKKFEAIAKAVSDKGFVLVFLLRLSPVMPFAICCYILGITKLTFLSYTVATILGLAPCTLHQYYLLLT